MSAPLDRYFSLPFRSVVAPHGGLLASFFALWLLTANTSGQEKPPSSAFQLFGWAKPDQHLPYPRSRPLNQIERDTLAKVTLPMKCDFSSLVTLVHSQGGGGCGGYTAIAIFDILKKRECAYAPNGSYRFKEYFYNESRKGPAEFELNQLDVLQLLGCVPETCLPTNYDLDPVPIPSKAIVAEAASYRILSYSDIISSLTVDSLKRMLVLFGPLCAFGDTPGSARDGHVFALIGYDDLARKFTILNSFSDRWGEHGMMKMPYDSVERPPATQQFPRVRSVRYVINQPTPPSLYPYVARLNLHHNQSRNHLTVKLGAEGQQAETVWNHPNKITVPDRSLDLVIDVPLPAYASKFWPPGQGNRWFLEVSDDSDRQPGKEVVGRVAEVTLVDRRKAAARTGSPILYPAQSRATPLVKGGKALVYIPN